MLPWLIRRLLDGARDAVRHPHLVVAIGVLVSAGALGWRTLHRSPMFQVARIEMPPDAPLTPPDALLTRNIWDVDLRAVAHALSRQHPALKQVRVIRELPSTIRIEPVWRVAVAQLRMDRRWYPVDADGVVWPEGTAEPAQGPIRIVGVAQEPGGGPAQEESLKLALRLVQRLARAPGRVGPQVRQLNVANVREIRLTLDPDIEVRCGGEAELDVQLERLQASLKALDHHALPVKAIDVRFPEPVIIPS